MDEFEIKRKLAEARRKAVSKLDFDDDGDFDKDDLRTKEGKKFAIAVIVCMVILLVLVFK